MGQKTIHLGLTHWQFPPTAKNLIINLGNNSSLNGLNIFTLFTFFSVTLVSSKKWHPPGQHTDNLYCLSAVHFRFYNSISQFRHLRHKFLMRNLAPRRRPKHEPYVSESHIQRDIYHNILTKCITLCLGCFLIKFTLCRIVKVRRFNPIWMRSQRIVSLRHRLLHVQLPQL